MQNAHNSNQSNIASIYFKVVRTELSTEYDIDIRWSIEEMITNVKPWILRDFQLDNVELVDTNNDAVMFAEDGSALIPSTETLYEKYGETVYMKAFYIRTIIVSDDNAGRNAINTNTIQEPMNMAPSSSSIRRCVICMTCEPNMLLGPCNHLCICQNCGSSPTIRTCPICRVAIQNRTVVYM
jgi:Zinc finger, C3HC4 type (RING finger)